VRAATRRTSPCRVSKANWSRRCWPPARRWWRSSSTAARSP
jgi:hypothetical protein